VQTSAIDYMANGTMKKPAISYIDVQVQLGSATNWTASGSWKYHAKSTQSVFGRSDIYAIQAIAWGGGRYTIATLDGATICFAMANADSVSSSQYITLRGFY